MLRTSSCKIGLNLAEIVTGQGITLIPKKDSLLAELSHLATLRPIPSDLRTLEEVPYFLEDCSKGSVINGTYTRSDHDITMDNFIDTLTKLANNYVSFARATVNPEVAKFEDELTSALEAHKQPEAEDLFKVSFVKPHAIFSSHIYDSDIAGYSNLAKGEPIVVNFGNEVVTNFDFISYVMTGDEVTDGIISDWVNSIGQEVVKNYVMGKVVIYQLSSIEYMNYSMANYLFYKTLNVKTDLNAGLSLSDTRTTTAFNRDVYGSSVKSSLDSYASVIRNGTLFDNGTDLKFSYLDQNKICINLYEENFQKLADAGYNLDVVFGYVSGKNPVIYVTVNEVINNAQMHLENWSVVRGLYLSHTRSNKLSTFKTIAKNVFVSSINELTQAEIEIETANPKFHQQTIDLVYDYIDRLDNAQIECLDTIALDIVARIRFRFSNAYTLLKEMSDILKADESIGAEDAALYSCVNYIADYLLDQLNVVTK